MCGICGVVLTRPDVVPPAELPRLMRRMAAALRHRGPDDEGIELFDAAPPSPATPLAALGHRRLSVIDPAGGHQPIGNEDRSVWLVCNGEVYNFPELRRELVRSGHSMRTRSDSECLVHLYEDAGARMVHALCGMYAFAIWDARRNILTLARDRLGQKPLYYVHDRRRGLFAFASELKALVELPGFDRTVSAEALDLYLTFQYVPHPLCIFKCVRKLPPAHTLTYEPASGRVRLERYWRPEFRPVAPGSVRELKEELRARLSEATRIRLISDVPLGAFLSGGLDSSITVALMSRMGARPVRTFSIGFRERRYDETGYARLVARHCRSEHREEVVRPSALEVLPRLVWHYDEPFGDSSAIPTYYVSAVARRHVKVALGGDGGDECFGGYPRYAAAWLAERFDRVPRLLRHLAAPRLWRAVPVSVQAKTLRRRLQRFMLGLSLPPERRYLEWISIFSEAQRQELCSPGFRAAVEPEGPGPPWSLRARRPCWRGITQRRRMGTLCTAPRTWT